MKNGIMSVCAMLSAIVIACSTPTGMACACPPSVYGVYVKGVLQDRNGNPVANQLLGFDALSRSFPVADTVPGPMFASYATTAGDGTFRVEVVGTGTDSSNVRVFALADGVRSALPFARFPARLRILYRGTPIDTLIRVVRLP